MVTSRDQSSFSSEGATMKRVRFMKTNNYQELQEEKGMIPSLSQTQTADNLQGFKPPKPTKILKKNFTEEEIDPLNLTGKSSKDRQSRSNSPGWHVRLDKKKASRFDKLMAPDFDPAMKYMEKSDK